MSMPSKIYIKHLLVVTIALLFSSFSFSQSFSFKMLSSSKPTNLRGLSAVDSLTIWTCGNNGHIGKSIDGGTTWNWVNPIAYEKSDFRDVHAFSADTAIIMAAGTPALILRTTNGGITWVEAFRSDNERVFLDALDFWGDKKGICIGDWVDNKPYNLSTFDKGKTWQLQKFETDYKNKDGAYFAASGTCLRAFTFESDTGFIATISINIDSSNKHGFMVFEKLKHNEYDIDLYDAPYTTTEPSQGLFSLCIDIDNEIIWVVGGDYAKPNNGFSAFFDIDDDEFKIPQSQVNGYRSCVELFSYNNTTMVIACGPNGADISISNIEKIAWKPISQLPFNTAKKSRIGNTVFLCGKQGTIYKLIVK